MKIKIKKQEHYLLESELFNAIVSEDFYQQEKGKPYIMKIEHTESQERLGVMHFSSFKKAIKFFEDKQEHWRIEWAAEKAFSQSLESTLH